MHVPINLQNINIYIDRNKKSLAFVSTSIWSNGGVWYIQITVIKRACNIVLVDLDQAGMRGIVEQIISYRGYH